MSGALTPNKWEVIAGRYRLEREIARGGMGSVWAGYDKKLRRKVAVKLVPPDFTAQKDARERFEREAMAVAQLQSPHVVQVFDFGMEKQCPYIVMELLEGEDLRALLYRVKRMTLESVGHLVVQTAKALSAAHAVGIVHRDLKPGNVFLVKHGEEEIVKILDFGVAKKLGAEELENIGGAAGMVMGTPQFMSPEQARGVPDLDHRADLWALGIIAYRALTGKLPFHAATATEVVVQVCTVEPPAVSVRAPDLPRELDGFFARALAKDRDQRFQSAREMALAFSRISPVNFTTLSMPDPGPAIEEALRRARGDDDDLATVAVDSIRPPADLDADTPPTPPSRRGGAPPPLPPPRLPPLPRRSSPGASHSARGPITVRSPSSDAGVPAPVSSGGAATTAVPSFNGLINLDALAPREHPDAALSDALAEPASTPHGLSRASSQHPPASIRALESPPFAEPLVDVEPPGASGRRTLTLALAAVAVGAAVAVVGSVVTRDSKPPREPLSASPAGVTTGRASADDPNAATDRSSNRNAAGAPSARADSAAGASSSQTDGEPVAEGGDEAPSSPKARPSGSGVRRAPPPDAPKPAPLEGSDPKGSEHAPAQSRKEPAGETTPNPPSKPKGDDPFADRL